MHRDQPQPRLRVIGMFWGDRPEKKARRSLSTALWHIRRTFDNLDPIINTNQSVQFDFHGQLIIDTEEFEAKINTDNSAELKQAAESYKDNFLDGKYDDWTINERYHLESLYIKTLSQLMEHHEISSDYMQVSGAAQ